MTIPGLECFITVCQELNYTRAAEKLFISQPGVSKHIKALESELGVTLFDKSSTRKLKLTPAGRILYESLMRCQNDFSSACDQIHKLALSQKLELNYIEGVTLPGDLFDSLDRFQEQIRPAELTIQSIQHRDLLSALNHDQLAFLSDHEMNLLDGDYSSILLYRDVPVHLIASAQHPAFREGHTPRTEDLKDCVFYTSRGFSNDFVSKTTPPLFEAIGFETEIVQLRNYETVRLYLKNKKGFTAGTIFNEGFYADDLRTVKTPLRINFYLVWKKPFSNDHINDLIRILREFKPE